MYINICICNNVCLCVYTQNNGRGIVKRGLAHILPSWLLPGEGWVGGDEDSPRTEEQYMLLSPGEPKRARYKTGVEGILQGMCARMSVLV